MYGGIFAKKQSFYGLKLHDVSPSEKTYSGNAIYMPYKDDYQKIRLQSAELYLGDVTTKDKGYVVFREGSNIENIDNLPTAFPLPDTNVSVYAVKTEKQGKQLYRIMFSYPIFLVNDYYKEVKAFLQKQGDLIKDKRTPAKYYPKDRSEATYDFELATQKFKIKSRRGALKSSFMMKYTTS